MLKAIGIVIVVFAVLIAISIATESPYAGGWEIDDDD
jgi:ABC-type dipeptide/oligopeptide/nickel transport system permease subunit